MKSLKALRQALADKKAEGLAILDAFTASGADVMSEEDNKKLEAIEAEAKVIGDELDAAIEKAEADAALAKRRADLSAQPRGAEHVVSQVADAVRTATGITHQRVVAHEADNHGFNSFGEYAQCVMRASQPGGRAIDERLVIGAAPTTMSNEGSGEDGGYLVPPGYSRRIFDLSLEDQAFLGMTDNVPIEGNSMTFPRDVTTPWGSSGIQAYWLAEAAQMTQTKPVLGTFTPRLHKLAALVPITEEMREDASAIDAYVPEKSGEAIRWKINNSMVNGNGAGQPLGLMNAACKISQAKESGQTADTIVVQNVVKMYARALNPGRSVWLINPDAYHQLPLMTLGNHPIFMPPSQGAAQTPGGFLLGRPVLLTDTCQTVGDEGDIILVDFMGMVSITKSAGVRTETSIHLWFDYDVTAFRATFRVDAQPWLNAAVSPANGSTTRSHFITLAERT